LGFIFLKPGNEVSGDGCVCGDGDAGMSAPVELTPVLVSEPAGEVVKQKKKSKPPVPTSRRAGLVFPPSRIYQKMRNGLGGLHVGKKTRVALAAAMQFIIGNIIEDGYTVSRQRGLRARHIDEVLAPHLPLAHGPVVVVRGANRKTNAFDVGRTRYINEHRGKAKVVA